MKEIEETDPIFLEKKLTLLGNLATFTNVFGLLVIIGLLVFFKDQLAISIAAILPVILLFKLSTDYRKSYETLERIKEIPTEEKDFRRKQNFRKIVCPNIFWYIYNGILFFSPSDWWM